MTKTTQDVANDVVALARAGQLDAIGETYWAEDVVSIEAFESPMQRLQGRAAVKGKTEWWNGAHEVHEVQTYGPWVNGDQFTVRWYLDVTNRESGQRMQMEEIALFTVRDGLIVEEKFFAPTMG